MAEVFAGAGPGTPNPLGSRRPTFEVLAREVDVGALHAVFGDRMTLADGAAAFGERRDVPGKRVLEFATT